MGKCIPRPLDHNRRPPNGRGPPHRLVRLLPADTPNGLCRSLANCQQQVRSRTFASNWHRKCPWDTVVRIVDRGSLNMSKLQLIAILHTRRADAMAIIWVTAGPVLAFTNAHTITTKTTGRTFYVMQWNFTVIQQFHSLSVHAEP